MNRLLRLLTISTCMFFPLTLSAAEKKDREPYVGLSCNFEGASSITDSLHRQAGASRKQKEMMGEAIKAGGCPVIGQGRDSFSTIWLDSDHPISMNVLIVIGDKNDCDNPIEVENSPKWLEGLGLRVEDLSNGKVVTHWLSATSPERFGKKSIECSGSLGFDKILNFSDLGMEIQDGAVLKIEPIISRSACPFLKGQTFEYRRNARLYLVREAKTEREHIFKLVSESRIRVVHDDWQGGKDLLWQALEMDPSFYMPRRILLSYIARRELDVLQGFRLLKTFLPFRSPENRGISDTDFWTHLYFAWFLTDMDLAELYFTQRELKGLPETRTTLEQPILTPPKGFQSMTKFHERWQNRKRP